MSLNYILPLTVKSILVILPKNALSLRINLDIVWYFSLCIYQIELITYVVQLIF